MDAKKHLAEADPERCSSVVAGERTPQELKEYRDGIAHWWTGKVDYSFVTAIQKTVAELLRRKCRG